MSLVRAGQSYYQVQIEIPREFEEAISNFLIENGSSGIKVDENKVVTRLTGYFKPRGFSGLPERTKRYLKSLHRLYPRFIFHLTYQIKKTEDWSKRWRKNFEPVLVGKKLVIIPSWSKAKFPSRLVIRIYPQMAFGTGTHPTTQSCLLSLTKLVKPGDKVLDLGTGSGILAIAAVKLGASSVLAVDSDATVKENVLKNLKLNRVENKIKLKISRLANLQLKEEFDLVVANLTGREIFEEFENLRQSVKSNGYIIISGWTKENQKELIGYLKEKRVKIVELKQKKSWVTAVCRK